MEIYMEKLILKMTYLTYGMYEQSFIQFKKYIERSVCKNVEI